MNNYIVNIDGKKLESKVNSSSITIGNTEYNDYELIEISANKFILKLGDKIYESVVEKINGDQYSVTIEGLTYAITVRSQLEEKAHEFLKNKAKQIHSDKIVAPMPGLILKINKSVGDEIAIGESLIILEAMKMENEIRATSSGKIKEIYVNEGISVEKNQLLITIE